MPFTPTQKQNKTESNGSYIQLLTTNTMHITLRITAWSNPQGRWRCANGQLASYFDKYISKEPAWSWFKHRYYELSVLIIIFRLFLSATTKALASKIIFIVSTTLWKLLAAPRSCVNRMMLSGCFLPCSITVITSAAKDTSFRFKTKVSVSSGAAIMSRYHSQFLAAILAKTMFLCLSTWMSRMPYLRHSRRRMVTSWRARLLEIVMQMWSVAGLTLNRRASQFCLTSMLRTGPEPDSCHLDWDTFAETCVLPMVLNSSEGRSSFWSGPINNIRSPRTALLTD